MENEKSRFTRIKRPLGKSITVACVMFILSLCVVLGSVTHFTYKKALYQRYQSFITDILNYVDRYIDDDDLLECILTLKRSEKYDELERFMDGIKEDFSIHYLYILKPLALRETQNVMSVLSAENHYDRYIDTEGNLYLGWVSDDEFDIDTVVQFFKIMESREITFFEEKTEWSTDYTGALTLFDSNKKPYAILAVDVDITDISKLIRIRTIEFSSIIVLLGALFIFIFLLWAQKNITVPIRLLEKSVVAFAKNSHGKRSIDALTYSAPDIKTRNEVESLATAVTIMTEDMKDYVEGIISAERKADEMQLHAKQMTELANKDALTGIRNKAAYDKEVKKMEYDLSIGRKNAFGIAMVDLNFLKKINDTYGHEQGNFAIKKLCFIVCTIFNHSPVFRIGGDEFVIVLRGHDYEHYEELKAKFQKNLAEMAADEKLEPWEKVSAAIGAAFYDKEIDANVGNVFRRADQKMYECKKEMKALRED